MQHKSDMTHVEYSWEPLWGKELDLFNRKGGVEFREAIAKCQLADSQCGGRTTHRNAEFVRLRRPADRRTAELFRNPQWRSANSARLEALLSHSGNSFVER